MTFAARLAGVLGAVVSCTGGGGGRIPPEAAIEKVSVKGAVVALSKYVEVIPVGATVIFEKPYATSFVAAKNTL